MPGATSLPSLCSTSLPLPSILVKGTASTRQMFLLSTQVLLHSPGRAAAREEGCARTAQTFQHRTADCPSPRSPAGGDEATDPGPAWFWAAHPPRRPQGGGGCFLQWRHLVGMDGHSRLPAGFQSRRNWWEISIVSRFRHKVRLQKDVKIMVQHRDANELETPPDCTPISTRVPCPHAVPCGGVAGRQAVALGCPAAGAPASAGHSVTAVSSASRAANPRLPRAGNSAKKTFAGVVNRVPSVRRGHATWLM